MSVYESFWGPPTASLDWCEVNYSYSPYIAEFWNTFSSLWLTFLAFFGSYHGLRLHVRPRVHLAYAALGVVGIGSALFHATLLYSCQLLDELPMIYGVLIFVYTLFEFDKHSVFGKLFTPVLSFLGIFITVVMLTHRDAPILHQASYGILVFVLVFRAIYLTYGTKLSALERSNFQYLLRFSTITFASGYVTWITERKLCYDGYVIPYVQLHSFWHLLTGMGTFGCVQFVTYYLQKDRTLDVEFKHLFGVIPYLDKRNLKLV